MKTLSPVIAELLKAEIHRNEQSGDFDKRFRNLGLTEQLSRLNELRNLNALQPEVQGGHHLGYVREYIQRKCVNGERVTWGSHDVLQFRNQMTVHEMEYLATQIAIHTLHEVFKHFTTEVCALPETIGD